MKDDEKVYFKLYSFVKNMHFQINDIQKGLIRKDFVFIFIKKKISNKLLNSY